MKKILILALSFLCGICFAGNVTLENKYAKILFDEKGFVISIIEKENSRELVERSIPFIAAISASGSLIEPFKLQAKSEKELVWSFNKGMGDVVLAVDTFEGGWIFSVKDVSSKDVTALEYCRFAPACKKWKGSKGS